RDDNVLRLAETSNLIKILSILIEDLYPPVPSIRHVNTAVSIDVNGVHRIELTIPFTGGAPLHEELPILVELHHARVRVAVTDKERSVAQPRDVGWAAKMFLVGSRHACFSKSHH